MRFDQVEPKNIASQEKRANPDAFDIAVDFGKSFAQSAVITPLWDGVGQLVSAGHLHQISITNGDNATVSSADSWAQKIGSALGMATDFFLLSKLKAGLLPEQTAAGAQSLSLMSKSMAGAFESAKTGAVYGAIFTPSAPGDNLITGRLKNAATAGITFGVLAGLAEGAGGLPIFKNFRPATVANALKDMGVAGTVGLPAGAIGAETNSLLNDRKLSSWNTVKSEAIDYGIVGFALSGMTHSLNFRSNSASETGAAQSRSSSKLPGSTQSHNVLEATAAPLEKVDRFLGDQSAGEGSGPRFDQLVNEMAKKGISPDDLHASIRPNNLLGGGRTAEGFAIDSLPNYVLRVPRDYVPAPVTLQAVDDVFPGHNVGQAVAAAGRLTIHLRQEGTAIGIHPHTRSVIGEAASEELLTKNIRSAAALPQAAYDGLASELQLLQEHGLALDPNPSNVLIASNKFNVVDVARYDVARSPENQVSLSTLLNGLMDLTQPKVIPSLQGELSQIRLKAILAAQHTGLPMHLADCKWFFSVGDGEAQWNRLHHLQGIEAPSLT